MFETKSGVIGIAGLGFFLLAFLSNGLVPWMMYANLPEKSVEQMLHDQLDNPNRARNVMQFFRGLNQWYPQSFQKYYGKPEKPEEWLAKCAEALRLGRKVYIGEGCWHCHSQFVRPVSNEEPRWGPVSQSWEYQNELQRPVMFGTRRVGPDLTREGGRHSNDWHVVHFFKPKMTSPESVMPDYPWFFDDNTADGPGQPNKKGIAIITYMQWLSSWLDNYPYYHDPNGGPLLEGRRR
jgi:cytochrome c oxidase cbb3-type subunit II